MSGIVVLARRGVAAILCACAAMLVGASAAEAYPTVVSGSVSVVSDPEDYVGHGEAATLSTPAYRFTAYPLFGEKDAVNVYIEGAPGEWFWVELAAPLGRALGLGTYTGAVSTTLREGDRPGMNVGGFGRNCGDVAGTFTVTEIEWSDNPWLQPYVQRLRATFEQHCNGSPASLRGSVAIDNAVPSAPLEITGFDVKLKAVKVARKGIVVTGTVTCSKSTSAGVVGGEIRQNVSFRETAVGQFLVEAVRCSTTPTPWSAVVQRRSNARFVNGKARVVASTAQHDDFFEQEVFGPTLARTVLISGI